MQLKDRSRRGTENRCVTFRPPCSRPGKRLPAAALVLLALFAQFWLAQVSTAHWGQMLQHQALWRDVCSTQNTPTSSESPDAPPAHAMGGMHCPVCSAVAVSFTPSRMPAAVAAPAADAFYRVRVASATLPASRHTNLRPPPQGPPATA